MLERERKIWAEQSRTAAVVEPAPRGGRQPGRAVAPAGAAPETAPAAAERPSDDPYIETPRCTSCNECTQINDKMFAYDANKQAYIANADAGTYRQLVEAAENCQVSIIHPGKPRNPDEPGLDELIRRGRVIPLESPPSHYATKVVPHGGERGRVRDALLIFIKEASKSHTHNKPAAVSIPESSWGLAVR